MKRQNEGVAEKLLVCAEAEFLEKGFKEASLRRIAKNSGVSTSSIYTRFVDKAGLFSALVAPVVDEFQAWFMHQQKAFQEMESGIQRQEVFVYSEDPSHELIAYVYQHFNVFKLLIMKSEGTKFVNFVNEMVELEVGYTTAFIRQTGSNLITTGYLAPELLHILASAYYAGIFETVIHDMPYPAACEHVKKLRRFFMCGWNDLFAMGYEKNENA